MNQKLIDLAMANADHYNNHPKAHIAMMGAYAVIAGFGYRKLFQKVVNDSKY